MKQFRVKPSMSLFACAACALGLLLWARLLLVSSPPRIATAQPAPANRALVCPAPDQQGVKPAHDAAHPDEPGAAPDAAQKHD